MGCSSGECYFLSTLEGLEIRCPCPSFLGAVVGREVDEVCEPSEEEMQNSDHFSVSSKSFCRQLLIL